MPLVRQSATAHFEGAAKSMYDLRLAFRVLSSSSRRNRLTRVLSTPQEIVDLYHSLGRAILAENSTDGALGAIARVAVAKVGGTAYASITRGRDSGYQTLGATHPDAVANDQLQYDLSSGPCVDALEESAHVLLVPSLATDARYPEFGPAAAATGAASLMSVSMRFTETEIRASLNLYSRELDAFDDTAEMTALLLAAHGALAVSNVVARERAANLERALLNSRNIGMAIGILMSSMLVTSEDAFTMLRIASQTRNRKLSVVAADVIETGTLSLP